MSSPTVDILAPCGTPRFYYVRECTKCGAGQQEHAAGKFYDPELLKPCKGDRKWTLPSSQVGGGQGNVCPPPSRKKR
jgi:hypothetical protein